MALKQDAIGQTIGPFTREYTWRDVVLYALGVGAGFKDLDYCYEERLQVIPSFAVALIFDFLAGTLQKSGANIAGILHGEHEMLFHAPLPTAGKVTTEGRITQLYDKGPDKGALVISEAETRDGEGRRLVTNVFTLFCRLDGGFGGPDAPKESFAFPARKPDFEHQERPSADQPLLYRLSGDVFPLHVDPEFARGAGFEQPIMHGLCTHGFACRALVQHLFPGEPRRMKRYKVRFSKALYPGIPVKTQIWKEGPGRAVFRTLNANNGEVVIDRGVVEWDAGGAAAAEVKPVRFDHRVAVITGAGGGLGRVYALELARRGARVVVNDLGGARDGGGGGSRGPADKVVDEIRALGGEAVASYDSIATEEGGRALVERAVAAFGKLDILVHNAGILRDKSLVKMEKADWDQVLAVHLDGAYHVCRPALQRMRDQGYGRIVLSTSAAGLFGNFGQANYAAAKLGLCGFMNTLELEGAKYEIKVNAVAPLAATRLTQDVFPPELLERLKPELVAPLLLFLCSEECPASGCIYHAGAGVYGRAAMVSGPAVVVSRGEVPAPEDVAARIEAISSLAGAREFDNATNFLGTMFEALQAEPEKPAGSGAGGAGLTVAAVFEGLPAFFRKDAAAGVSVVFQFKVTGAGGGEWQVEVKDQACAVKAGLHPKPTTTIILEAADFLEMMQGRVKAMKLYTTKKLKIEGDLMKSQLVEKLFAMGKA